MNVDIWKSFFFSKEKEACVCLVGGGGEVNF